MLPESKFRFVGVLGVVALWICSTSVYAAEGDVYMCFSDLCIVDDGSHSGDHYQYESQQDCRLSCGSYGAIWPQPTGNVDLSPEREQFSPSNVDFSIEDETEAISEFLHENNRIFLKNIIKECGDTCSLQGGNVLHIEVEVNSQSLVLNWSTDESYTLSVSTTGARISAIIKAETVYGARHGLETLSNLVTASKQDGLIIVKEAYVQDRPTYPHRGVLLDTSRNFIPLHFIRSTLDGMAASKLNVFHWHVVDSHSFPLEITRVPEMQRYGAYSPDQVYSHADTKNIINYARLRGIRVIIEIDGPSHAGSGWQWGPAAGLGDLSVCINQQPWYKFCGQPPCGQLNPFNEHMYDIMSKIYEELAELNSAEDILHMGGDEVSFACWNSTEQITKKIRAMGFDFSVRSFLKLWAEFHQRNLKSWDKINEKRYPNEDEPKPVIIWSSQLTNPRTIETDLPKDRFIIQTWVDRKDPLNRELLELGYRLIFSTLDAWYFDHGFWGGTSYYNWAKVYENFIISHKNVLGGEVCMWSEYVSAGSIDARIWPRAGAAAERLWSDPNTSAQTVKERFFRYRQRLITRGIHADAVTPNWCEQNDGGCESA